MLNTPDPNAGSGYIMVQPTQIDMRYETLPSSNMLFNTYEIKVNSKLFALFEVFEEGNMNSLKDLVPTHSYQ